MFNDRRNRVRLMAWLLSSAVFACTLPAQAGDPDSKPPARRRVALALGGGAVRGAAHIGVLRVLEKEGIPMDCIAGTSMGAIVGGLYAAGLSLDEIERRIRDKSLLHAYDTIPLWLRLALIPVLVIPRLLGSHPYEGLYRGNRFANYINKAVPESMRSIENLKIPFCAVACNLLDGKVYGITRGNLGRALQASSAIPVYRKPVPFEAKLLCDGGVLENLPTATAKSFNADIIIAVDVDPALKPADQDTFRKIGSVSNRTTDMILDKLDEPQRKMADVLIQPDVSGISLFVRDVKHANRAIRAGEEAARAAVPVIREALSRQSALAQP
jgi:NTE family protein